MFRKYFNDMRNEFQGYNAKKFSKDLMAGLTVTAVALPLALAFGVSSGADAAAGLITAIIAGLVIGLLSGGSYQISGPTGAMTAILIAVVMKFGMQGVFLAGLLSGVILLIAGVLKIGKLVSFIPSAVITGFTSGIAIIIALGQIDNFFGVTSKGENAIQKVASYFKNGFDMNIWAVVIAVGVVLVMAFFPKKWNAKFPSSLVAIILVVIVNSIFNLPVAVVGDIPKTLFLENRLNIFNISYEQISGLIVPAISIAALGMIESLLCGASAGRMKNEKLDADRELVAQGIGNILLPFFGGVPATAAIARTSVAIKSGQETRLTSIIHSIGLLASMFLLGGVMSKIPLSALAGILMVTAYRMNEWKSIGYIFKNKFKSSIAQFLVTMVATVVFDLTIAILLGVLISVLLFVVRIANVQIETTEVDYDKLDIADANQKLKLHKMKVTYITGPLFFGSVERLENEIVNVVDCNTIILSMRGVPMIDAGAAHMFLETIEQLQQENITVLFSGLNDVPKEVLDRAGVVDLVGEENFYWDAKQAIESRL
ncbi:SulP family inorganic anion transporter [Paludicola sp. MB14-C6]|uniref:SulP family inorganic anion transporter n=1 Tax=Paludihabitans sp. MB14-C6 TaxID=3070656 RepID=UPI0027DCC7D0|nr:SulP family inorganic anion transporter [Paludicola sp. MB14-C6]WMJ23700.1 SulP family inorganic anion transporter [Paludicola sp. MB14-C6]